MRKKTSKNRSIQTRLVRGKNIFLFVSYFPSAA
jgi:hypothetical protein